MDVTRCILIEKCFNLVCTLTYVIPQSDSHSFQAKECNYVVTYFL